jgi:hypothetical protein
LTWRQWRHILRLIWPASKQVRLLSHTKNGPPWILQQTLRSPHGVVYLEHKTVFNTRI